MTRLAAQPHERIDRSQPVTFTYDGKPVQGFAGDTIGSALYAAGRRVFSRSFKYHRPRGLVCCSGHCANCQMTVDGVPNVRVCTTPVSEGAVVKGQNFVGSLDRDLMQVTDKLGGPFTPPGFYYKTFIRPRRLWPLYEKFLRGAAGLGRLDPNGKRTRARRGREPARRRRRPRRRPGRSRGGHRGSRPRRVGRRRRRGPRRRWLAARRPGRHRRRRDAAAARTRRGGRAARAGDRDRALRAGPRPRRPRQPAAQVPRPPRRRRERGRRAAARVPRQRPRRRDASGRRPPPRQLLVDQAGRAGRRADDGRSRAAGRGRPGGGRGRGRPGGRLPRAHAELDRGAGPQGTCRPGGDRRALGEVRPPRHVRQPAAQLQAARAGRRPGRVRRRQGGLRPARPARRRRGRRGRHRRRRLARGTEPGARPRRRQVLRLLLRGPDGEGPQVRDLRGLRLDRALEAVHDGDDGAVPGPALPRQLDPRLREVDRAGREHDRDDDGAAAVHAGRDGPRRRLSAGACQAHVAAPPPRGARRPHDVDRRLAPPPLVRAGRRRGGAGRAPWRRPDRRLDAREDPRQGPRRGGVPRPRLPEPLLRPEGRPHPLRRADDGLGPDHGRRHGRAPRRRHLLRDDDVDRGRQRLPVVHLVERRLVHGRPVRAADRRGGRHQRRRAERRAR